MVDSTDMTTPVTRGELREELAEFEQKFDQKLEKLEQRLDQKLEQRLEKFDQKFEQRFAQMASKADLEIWGGALLVLIERTEQRLSAELARHMGTIQESMSALFAASDEKYADLPGRVNRLEAAVFAPQSR